MLQQIEGPRQRVLNVPFVDLRAQHEELRPALDDAFRTILESSAFSGGPAVRRFEEAFARYVGADHAVGVGSGTDALRIALQAVGVRAGDAVVTVAHTFIATAEAITQAGAVPLFVDIEPVGQTLCPVDLERFLTDECALEGERVVHGGSLRRIAAIVPVHLYGQSADMEPILELAGRFGVPVVEDACQAHGATYRFPSCGAERGCGALADAAAFSFYPSKNLGAIGEAGALTTSDPAVAAQARLLRDHGQVERYVHSTAAGSNARLDGLQAAVLEIKLPRLSIWNEMRRTHAERYNAWFRDAPFGVPAEVARGRHVWHLYVVRVAERERIRQQLAEVGIQTGLHYPIPLHLQGAYAELGYRPGSLPETERAAAEVLSLPMYPHLSADAVDFVAETLLRVAR